MKQVSFTVNDACEIDRPVIDKMMLLVPCLLGLV